jgi:uncharacterized protein with LGFP repeats
MTPLSSLLYVFPYISYNIDTKQDAKIIVPANNNGNKKENIPVGHTILYNKGRITWKGEEKTQITKQENNKKS